MRIDKDGTHTLEEDIGRIWTGHGLEVVKEIVYADRKDKEITVWEIRAVKKDVKNDTPQQ